MVVPLPLATGRPTMPRSRAGKAAVCPASPASLGWKILEALEAKPCKMIRDIITTQRIHGAGIFTYIDP